ncbi:MAG: UDP-N-acetylmuramoyl-L-alanine--D-glutamate ligase [Fimbriimonadaceae bacterium]|nr:UDP-N-acetylmuramoyl-L-alanine--D-glutamate ligase [Fimbriimonadaceae bacterium]
MSRALVLGLGRSGVASARALLALGLEPLVVDHAPALTAANRTAADALDALGVEWRIDWKGTAPDLGATVLVTSPGVDRRSPTLLGAVAAGIEVIGEIELAFRVAKAPIVAITGTNGKSTTTVMTWLGLKGAGFDAVLCGNIYGSGYPEVPLAEAALDASPDAVLVAEVSSFQLEWVRGFRPRAAAITNITPDHLNRYNGFEEYAQTKLRIFEAQGPEDHAVVPYGDPLVPPPSGPPVHTFGNPAADAKVEDGWLVAESWHVPLESLPFREPHNLANAQVALLLGRSIAGEGACAGFAKGLSAFQGLGHRLQAVGEREGVQFVNNSMCTNPAAVVASSRALGDVRQHLLVGGETKGLDFRPLAALLAGGRVRLYLFGKGAPAIRETIGDDALEFRTMAEAFGAAAGAARSGEVVMLAPGCASTDQFADFRERGEVFVRLAKEWLER